MTSDMSASVLGRQSPVPPLMPLGVQPVAVSRPQVGIERLPTRRLSNEPRESMNCKSCRKRKIKCNRLRPACEACQVFQVPCIYDAVPKKRGPKTDVLEALLKRVDGLEQRLRDQKKDDGNNSSSSNNNGGGPDGTGISGSASSNGASVTENTSPATTTSGDATVATNAGMSADGTSADTTKNACTPSRDATLSPNGFGKPVVYPTAQPTSTPVVPTSALLNTYFTRFHAKPFHVLDESSFRQRLQLNQIPLYLINAICGLASRFTPHPNGYEASVKLGEEYALRARAEIDTDEPSVDCLQALLLLCLSFNASGKGKKAYMVLTNAIGMALALELHREMDAMAKVMPVEREMRRRLFWTCYLLDRYMASGSRRPSLISDRTILLRLPCWSPGPASMPIEGDFFQSSSNLQHLQGGGGKKSQGSSGMLIDITRILGITNQYMAAGGVKGDSHFPWHSLSNLSKIRQDLDIWASGSQDIFSSVEVLFSQPDSSVLVLSKLVYHLIHCLIYRPFLPVDLAELSGTGQHQSWQIEATNLCFLHANAIAELVALGKQMPQVEWAGFVGYCICTAGTVHIHGAHYNKVAGGGEMSVFASSSEFLSREMQQLDELRYKWACVQHHRETLQNIYNAHIELIKSLGNNPMRYTPVFHLDDFFDRYSNIGGPAGISLDFDTANLSLADVVDYPGETYRHDMYSPNSNPAQGGGGRGDVNANAGASTNGWDGTPDHPAPKRRKTAPSITTPSNATPSVDGNSVQTPAGMPAPSPQQPPLPTTPYTTQMTPGALDSPRSMGPPLSHSSGLGDHAVNASPTSVVESIVDITVFSPPSQSSNLAPQQPLHHPPTPQAQSHVQVQAQMQTQHHQHHRHQQNRQLASATPFSPTLNFPALAGTGSGTGADAGSGSVIQSGGDFGGYDPMFGTLPTNAFTSPTHWPGEDVTGHAKPMGMALQQSPGVHSTDGSVGGTAGEEKDPFLCLLEQLAENEFAHGPGNELDFFLTGPPTQP